MTRLQTGSPQEIDRLVQRYGLHDQTRIAELNAAMGWGSGEPGSFILRNTPEGPRLGSVTWPVAPLESDAPLPRARVRAEDFVL